MISEAARNPVLVPDHELLRVIGRGSYGEVWQARNVMGTPRAVKVVRRLDFEQTRPFDREFEGIQKYEPVSRSHDGLVQVLHVGKGRGADYFYYVMELADDAEAAEESKKADETGYRPRTLRDELHRRGALPVEECIEIGIALASALSHLHRHGLVHRDVKPSNIIFVNGRAKLADVGLVALMSDTRSLVGTEGFSAPEGSGLPRGDVFSLGRVLYECVTGYDRLRFPDVPDGWVGTAAGKASFEFLEIVLRAGESDPKRRYEGAGEMLADLALLRAGKSLRHLRRVETRLRRALQVLTISAAAMTLAGGAWFYERGKREQIEMAEREASLAQRETQKQLGESLINEARAIRLSGRAGARERALTAAGRALETGVPRVRPRTEAASALGLMDVGEFSPPVPAERSGSTRTVLSEECAFMATWSPGGEARILARAPRGPELLARFPVRGDLWDIQLSRGGRWLAAHFRDNSMQLWDARTGALMWSHAGDTAATTLWFSKDAEWLIMSAPGGLMARRCATGESTLLVPGLPVCRYLLISPDASWLAALVGEDGGFRIFTGLPGHFPSEEDAAKIRADEIKSDIALTGPGVSEDSRYLAACVGEDEVRVWEMPGGALVAALRGHQRNVRGTAFHPRDSAILASTSWDGTTRLWDVPTKTEALTAPAGGDRVYLSPDSGEILLRSWAGDSIRSAPLASPRGIRVLPLPPTGPPGLFSSVEFSPDGTMLAAAGDAGVLIWDLTRPDTRSVQPPGDNRWRDAVFSRSGDSLWSSGLSGLWRHPISRTEDGGITVGEAARLAPGPLTDITLLGADEIAVCLNVYQENRSGLLRIVNHQGGIRDLKVPHVPDTVRSSSDGRWLSIARFPASGGTLIDLAAVPPVMHPVDAISRCAFGFVPGLPALVVGTEKEIRFQPLPGAPAPAVPYPVIRRAFSEFIPGRLASTADGSLVAASTGAMEISLFRGGTLEKLATLDSPLTPFDCALTFSPDGGKLALAGGVSRVVIWDIKWLREELTRRGLGW